MSSLDDDDVDLATLQAQIDVSMAATTALVSTWINPALRMVQSHRTSEKEFEESLRRPPRLGVGAPLPESAVGATAREAARLKGRLTGGNKRRRLDVDNAIVPDPEKDDDDDDEDSRGRSIKKKLRVDPFAMKSSKGGNKQGLLGGDSIPPVLRENEKTSKVEGTKDLVALGLGTSGQSPPTSSSPPSKAKSLQPGIKESLPKEDAPASRLLSPITSTKAAPERDMPPSPTTQTKQSKPAKGVLPPDNVKIEAASILNLQGPPSESCAQDVASLSKKKRRRRKKKKSATISPTDAEESDEEDER